jgi:hypothetical protein
VTSGSRAAAWFRALVQAIRKASNQAKQVEVLAQTVPPSRLGAGLAGNWLAVRNTEMNVVSLLIS